MRPLVLQPPVWRARHDLPNPPKSNLSIWRANSAPATIAAPTQSDALAADAAMNAGKRIFSAPARGGATVANLPVRIWRRRRRRNPSARRFLRSVARTYRATTERGTEGQDGFAYGRPAQNHGRSATSDAATEMANAGANPTLPATASAPASIIVGTAGIGRPSCCSNTLRPMSGTP